METANKGLPQLCFVGAVKVDKACPLPPDPASMLFDLRGDQLIDCAQFQDAFPP
jgi:hypothetical protein